MTKQFVQVNARKDSNNFMYCTNMSPMDLQKLSYHQALRKLQVMVDEYELNGYKVEWTTKSFDAVDEEYYSELFA